MKDSPIVTHICRFIPSGAAFLSCIVLHHQPTPGQVRHEEITTELLRNTMSLHEFSTGWPLFNFNYFSSARYLTTEAASKITSDSSGEHKSRETCPDLLKYIGYPFNTHTNTDRHSFCWTVLSNPTWTATACPEVQRRTTPKGKRVVDIYAFRKLRLFLRNVLHSVRRELSEE